MSDDEGKGKTPAIFAESTFSVEEGAAYRVFRTGAIWMNKLFFGAIALLAVWLFLGLAGAVSPDCATTVQPTVLEDGSHADVETEHCSVWLSTTAKYLGAMAVISFAISIAFGLLGLVVGKKILEMTPHAEETAVKAQAELEAANEGDKE